VTAEGAIIPFGAAYDVFAFPSVLLSGGSACAVGYQYEDYIIPAVILPIGIVVMIIGATPETSFH
jgi:hypothetical protein